MKPPNKDMGNGCFFLLLSGISYILKNFEIFCKLYISKN